MHIQYVKIYHLKTLEMGIETHKKLLLTRRKAHKKEKEHRKKSIAVFRSFRELRSHRASYHPQI